MSEPQPIYLKDYKPPVFLTKTVEMCLALDPQATRVRSKMRIQRLGDARAVLELHGEAVQLGSILLDGERLDDGRFDYANGRLRIGNLPGAFTLEIDNIINPAANTALMGLYMSNGMFCTQCEAEGFRRITFFQDRPDVLTIYTVRIEADSITCPVLLSNGNKTDAGDLGGGRHFVEWHDPHPKPAYLFALVAGDLERLEETFTTKSGRKIGLHIYARAKNLDQCHFAMDALKRSMRWDEEIYDLEYDLDLFQIVAVDDFNMGAMENKGLNIFNAAAILVRPDIATDQDFMTVERIIAHEYFHNWTGNRVTCRDWFQLTLKEGLTVYRDQQFSSDMHSAAVKRIGDVMLLRDGQFAEDAGPLAHPVRPNSYLEVNNFYTRTVYEKGAEIIRMLHRLIGEQAYYRGIRLYFERHDGSAATCEDFVQVMADASGQNLDQFMRWYGRAGTPILHVVGAYDAERAEYRMEIEQELPAIRGQENTGPLHMPIEIGLIGQNGEPLQLRLRGEDEATGMSRMLPLHNLKETFVFTNVASPPTPSLLRGFTAPVRLKANLSAADQRHLMAHDPDSFVRWSAAQKLYLDAMLKRVSELGCADHDLAGIAQSGRAILGDDRLDPALVSGILVLPSCNVVGQELERVDVDAVASARKAVRRYLIEAWRADLSAVFTRMEERDNGAIETAAIAARSLKNRCLSYLLTIQDPAAVASAEHQYRNAEGMTDRLSALAAIAHFGPPELASELLADFYMRFEDEPLVINKWFALQASTDDGRAVARIGELIAHPAFTFVNPNRVRSVLGVFAAQCFEGFHEIGGAGYRLIADHGLLLDAKNPQVAARLLIPLGRWRRYTDPRSAHMKTQLERLRAHPGLSRDSLEIVQRSLAA